MKGNINESLPRQQSVDQLKKLRKLTKGIDIGDRIKMDGTNKYYDRNPIDTGIISYEDFEKKNKSYTPSWNLKHMKSPFKDMNKIKRISESIGIENLTSDVLTQLKDEQDRGHLITNDYYIEYMEARGYDGKISEQVYNELIKQGFKFDIDDDQNRGDNSSFNLKTL